MICNICGNSRNNKKFWVKEMMFGLRDEFTYFECSDCGCLQIAEVPKNMRKYYPSNYYSLKKELSDNFVKRILKGQRNKYALFRKGIIGKLIYKIYPNSLFNMIGLLKVNYNSRILDIGCGAGNLLCSLNEIGFKNLLGLEPYINKEIINGDVKILKKSVHELLDNQKFDLIISNHSFEHIPDQLATLLKVRKILSGNGTCLVRMPVKTEYIWKRYGVNWVQIDAPRHLFIHTPESFRILVDSTGLIINDVIYDSNEFQFWGSEQYKKDISLKAENSYSINSKKSIFSKKDIMVYKRLAKKLNIQKQGDQAIFILRRNEKIPISV